MWEMGSAHFQDCSGLSFSVCEMEAACGPGPGIQEGRNKWRPPVAAAVGTGVRDPKAQTSRVLPVLGGPKMITNVSADVNINDS